MLVILTTMMQTTTNKGAATMDNLNNLIDWRLELTLEDAKCYGARQGVGRRVMVDDDGL